ncbi:hypothetical protein CDV31_014436 [Fusarium ambrosium]|uniref:Uncharacterized protein n=1 Tax=Fusarium ambrosium TaxID=131363 RepID=A0A428SWS6_9HYPO|nr:hypothetical protein CDV31_014436 [Fusarium ambrosium]
MATPSMSMDAELAAWKPFDEDADADTNWTGEEAPAFESSVEHTIPAEEAPLLYTPWQELQVAEDAKMEMAAQEARKAMTGSLYNHLRNSEIDWSIEGRYICRVVGMSCFGKKFDRRGLTVHLKGRPHLRYDAQVTPPRPQRPQTPVSAPMLPQLPARNRAVRVVMMEIDTSLSVESAMDITPPPSPLGRLGSGLVAQDQVMEDRPPTPPPSYPLDAVIPDSEAETSFGSE